MQRKYLYVAIESKEIKDKGQHTQFENKCTKIGYKSRKSKGYLKN